MSDDIATKVAQKMNGDLEASRPSAGDKWAVNGNSTLGTILVTGGAGYIGSHCCVQLLEEGFRYASPSRRHCCSAESPSRSSGAGDVDRALRVALWILKQRSRRQWAECEILGITSSRKGKQGDGVYILVKVHCR